MQTGCLKAIKLQELSIPSEKWLSHCLPPPTLGAVPIPASQVKWCSAPRQKTDNMWSCAAQTTAADISPTPMAAPESVGHQTTPKTSVDWGIPSSTLTPSHILPNHYSSKVLFLPWPFHNLVWSSHTCIPNWWIFYPPHTCVYQRSLQSLILLV